MAFLISMFQGKVQNNDDQQKSIGWGGMFRK
jgi:hypothetical protein